MACRTSAENIRIEPVHVTWEQQEITSVVTVADSTDSLDGTYFEFSTPSTEYYAWISTSGGTAVDPAVVGKTGIEVSITTDDTAAAVATALSAAIDAEAGLNATVDACNPAKVYIQSVATGAVLSGAADSVTATGFTVAQARAGSKLEVGFIDGDIELALTEDVSDQTAHQTGTQIITALRTGRNIDNVSLTMKESDAAKLKTLIEASGTEFTPSGGTAVSAWGSEDTKAFGNVLTDCRKLVLHPIRLPDNDLSGDFCFWRAYPLLSGITLSGESPRTISVDFKILPDQLLDVRARQFVYGDHTQNFFS